MTYFTRQGPELFAEQVSLQDIAARYGTPTYVYSRAALTANFLAYENALADHPHLTCYAVKANSNLAVLNVLARLGAGFDMVSQGELERVIRAGGDPAKVIFFRGGQAAFGKGVRAGCRHTLLHGGRRRRPAAARRGERKGAGRG